MTKTLTSLAAAANKAVGTPNEAAAARAYYDAKAEDAEIRIIQADYSCTYAQARSIYKEA